MSEASYYPVEEETTAEDRRPGDCFKEAVCIDAMRVYDSCGDKEYARYRYKTTAINFIKRDCDTIFLTDLPITTVIGGGLGTCRGLYFLLYYYVTGPPAPLHCKWNSEGLFICEKVQKIIEKALTYTHLVCII